MTAELWLWIGIACAIVVVGLWPVLMRNRRQQSEAEGTVETARVRIAELEDQLDRPDLRPKSRTKAERSLLLAGAALAKGGRAAPDRAGRYAEAGLATLRETGSP